MHSPHDLPEGMSTKELVVSAIYLSAVIGGTYLALAKWGVI